MNKITLLLLTLKIYKQCTVGPGFQEATLQQQINKAGAIVMGMVESLTNPFNPIVTLARPQFFKGCVSGF